MRGDRMGKRLKRSVLRGSYAASLTVEAALILPILLSALLFFLSFLQIIRVEQKLYYAAAEIAEETASCGYVMKYAQQEFDALWEDGGEYGAVTGFVTDLLQGAGNALGFRRALRAKLADEDCIEAMVVRGVGGIDFWGSEIYAEDEMSVICMEFDISFPVFQRFIPKLPLKKYVVLRSFSGEGQLSQREEEGGDGGKEEESGAYVYVTESGTVYHVLANCSYIRLSVEKVKSGGIADRRNQYGGKYYPCDGCLKKNAAPETVWVTKSGTHYHASRDCGKIKRTVKKIPLSEASMYRPCSRCAKGE